MPDDDDIVDAIHRLNPINPFSIQFQIHKTIVASEGGVAIITERLGVDFADVLDRAGYRPKGRTYAPTVGIAHLSVAIDDDILAIFLKPIDEDGDLEQWHAAFSTFPTWSDMSAPSRQILAALHAAIVRFLVKVEGMGDVFVSVPPGLTIEFEGAEELMEPSAPSGQTH